MVPTSPTKTITVDNLTALAQVHVAELEWGTLAWVKSISFGSNGALYVLLKAATFIPNGTTFIAPAAGSPIAGNSGTLWAALVAFP